MASKCVCREATLLSGVKPLWKEEIRSAIKKINCLTNKASSPGLGTGIGNATMKKLREEKATRGDFTSLEEVLSIPRIGKRICRAVLSDENIQEFEKYLYKANCVSKVLEFNSLPDSNVICFPDLVSVDFGLKNASWIQLSCNLEILEWERVDTHFPDPYGVEQGYSAMMNFASRLPRASVFVLEGQSHRVMNRGGFMKIGLQLRLQEALLYTILSCTHRSIPVVSLHPKVVLNVLDFQSRKSKEKKKMAVHIAEKLISQESSIGEYCPGLSDKVLKVAPNLVDRFNSEIKKDDLSDSLLQGIAFYECVMSHFLLQQTSVGSSGLS